jgi:CBS domain-containing protein
MKALNVRRLPVIDKDSNLVGIISDTDIFMAVEERGWEPSG